MSSEHVSRSPKAPKRGASSRADAVRRSFDSAKAALAESELRDVRLSARTLRWGLLAVAVGAVVAALVTLFVTGFDNETGLEAHNPGSPAQPVLDKEFGTAAKGDCLSWTKPDRSDLVKVNCASKHMFEVAADIDMSRYPGKEFGPGSRFPDSLRLTELKEEHCVPAVQKYMSGRFDPRGKYIVGLMYPSPDGWQHGDRTLRCGLQVAASVGTPPSVGSATEHDQSRVYEPGVCLGINQNLPTDPVDCAQPHAVEIVATVDLATHFTGGPPAKEEQDKFVEEECSRTSTEYLGAPDVIRNKTLTLFFDYIDARSWMAGSRKLDCMIGKGADREGFAPITGSAKGDILINGQAPVPPPNSGRSTPAPLPGAAPLPPQPQPR
ncbi:septum formation family protein [Nocardia abscessus]|uniref:septum formation family protein n=1 Tax=Nocardia abscessus TaxID=120957 RepID=UPI00030DBEC7|nr:septum formation family protein [Nocardia abscessus]MCC3327914.1 septum formation family protein [Nocardia abscessus]